MINEYGIANKRGMTKKLWNRFARKFKKKETVKNTKRDYMMLQIWERIHDVDQYRALYDFMENQDVGTDCYEADLAIFREQKTSNLRCAMDGD